MNYTFYEIEDFLTNESFLNYCSGQNEQDIQFWNNWLKANPEKKEIFSDAVLLYTSLNGGWDKKILAKDFEVFRTKLYNRGDNDQKEEYIDNDKIKSTIKIWYTILSLAAALFLTISIVYYFNQEPSEEKRLEKSAYLNDVSPGSNKAVLTLANGSRISLTDAVKGEILVQSDISITKTKEGEVVFTVKSVNTTEPPTYSTIQTPRGGQYKINLPDGTQVFLNAESSLRFPNRFSTIDRAVKLIGEGYFEVTKDKKRPFIVSTSSQMIRVLGTQFNVNAYNDKKSVKTTLVEGSVSVVIGNKAPVLLRPGQQSSSNDNGILVRDVDLNEAIAWKDGYFMFKNDSIEDVMSEISRWYDVNVMYNDGNPNVKFTGAVSKTKNISAILKAIEETSNVKFKIQGKNITVLKP